MSTTMVSHLNEAATMLVPLELNSFLLSTLSCVAINLHSCSLRKWKRSLGLSSFYILFAQCTGYGIIERFSYDLEMKTREQNRNNKRTEIERFDWFIERIQTRVAFGWLSERSGEKTSCPRTFYKSTDTSLWCHTTTRLANRTMTPLH